MGMSELREELRKIAKQQFDTANMWKSRAETAENERDRLQADNADLVQHCVGRREAAEMWKARAEAAESERDRLAERVRELEERSSYSCQCEHKPELNKVYNECDYHKGIRERAETAEVKLAVAVEALEAIGYSWGHGGAHDIAKSSLAKIKGAP